jgi:hypothetical protein
MTIMKSRTVRLVAAFAFTALLSSAADKPVERIWTNPEAASAEDPDFSIQGEYLTPEGGWGAQVIALGNGKFDAYVLQGGLPGAGWTNDKRRIVLHGTRKADEIPFVDEKGSMIASLHGASFLFSENDGMPMVLQRAERKSPTLGAKPPEGAVVLFDGTSTDAWENGRMENGLLLATGCTSKQKFGSYTLHLEFRTPYKPDARGQKRGNSGIYHSGRWETQILDSFGLEGKDNECGGIYSISKPKLNACLPPLAWQTYDVDFTAATFDKDGKRTAWPRITVKLNGIIVHENLELSKAFTTSAPINTPLGSPEGPFFLQNHDNPVMFRNIWIVPR